MVFLRIWYVYVVVAVLVSSNVPKLHNNNVKWWDKTYAEYLEILLSSAIWQYSKDY